MDITRYFFFMQYWCIFSILKISSIRERSQNKFVLHIFFKSLVVSLLCASHYSKTVENSEAVSNSSLQKSCFSVAVKKIKQLSLRPPFKICFLIWHENGGKLKIPWGIGLIFKKTFKIKSFNQLPDHLSENILLQETIFII